MVHIRVLSVRNVNNGLEPGPDEQPDAFGFRSVYEHLSLRDFPVDIEVFPVVRDHLTID
jgi:hypothetical protein